MEVLSFKVYILYGKCYIFRVDYTILKMQTLTLEHPLKQNKRLINQ